MEIERLKRHVDLTCLEDDLILVERLCQRAAIAQVAAVCIQPSFIAQANMFLQNTGIQIATVANFPFGHEPLSDVLASIQESLREGADEIDLVIPYRLIQAGHLNEVTTFLEACRKETKGHVLKLILETGMLSDDEIKVATRLSCDCHADFVKTSTGTVPEGATVRAVKAIVSVLQEEASAQRSYPSIKLSGGVNTLMTLVALMDCIDAHMPVLLDTFRIGTSKLLDNLQ